MTEMQSLHSLSQMLQALLADCEEARYWERQCKEEQKQQIDFSYGRNIPSPSSKVSTTEIDFRRLSEVNRASLKDKQTRQLPRAPK